MTFKTVSHHNVHLNLMPMCSLNKPACLIIQSAWYFEKKKKKKGLPKNARRQLTVLVPERNRCHSQKKY